MKIARNINHNLNSVIFLPKSESKKVILSKMIARTIEETADIIGCLLTKWFSL